MTFLLRASKTNTLFSLTTLCKQFSVIRVSTPSLIHIKRTITDLKETDVCREKAREIRIANDIRTRCVWTKEEDKLLMKLNEEYPGRWTKMSTYFVDRSPIACRNRLVLLLDVKHRGPWEKSEVKALIELCEGKRYEDVTDWERIQAALPRPRPIALIKQKYSMCDPHFRQGHWTKQETELLESLIKKYGEDWGTISRMIGTRSSIQCHERWKWQQQEMTKGKFTLEEDAKILELVKEYGLNFGVICKVMGTDRTPRHVSQHYHNMLDPDVDRSPWTEEEGRLIYETCVKLERNMKKTKELLNSKRSLRDMWNKFMKYEKIYGKKPSQE